MTDKREFTNSKGDRFEVRRKDHYTGFLTDAALEAARVIREESVDKLPISIKIEIGDFTTGTFAVKKAEPKRYNVKVRKTEVVQTFVMAEDRDRAIEAAYAQFSDDAYTIISVSDAF